MPAMLFDRIAQKHRGHGPLLQSFSCVISACGVASAVATPEAAA